MIWFWSIAAVTLLSFVAEYFLAYRRSKWPGLILPVTYFCAASVFLLLNLLDAFPQTEAFGSFLSQYGSAGFVALLLKIGFLYVPAVLHTVLCLVFRRRYRKTHHPAKHNKEYQKILADDLD